MTAGATRLRKDDNVTDILAIGNFTSAEHDALGAMGAKIVADMATAIALPEPDRAGARAIAYKSGTPFGAAQMAAFPGLGLISNFGVGFDAIDIDAASGAGIQVTNTPDVLNDDVADLAVAMLLMQGRRLVQAEAYARSGDWGQKGEFPLARKISGGRAGILGLGRIGFDIARRLAAFDMDIHYWSRREKEAPGWTYHADPVALASAVDYLIVAVVGGEETKGIVSAEVLDALGPDGIVVNISRGTTIDEGAMLDRLEDGRLAGAGLDVFLNEPKIDPRFSALDNVVLQPHIGSATQATRAEMARLQRDNITAFLAGRPVLTQVNDLTRTGDAT